MCRLNTPRATVAFLLTAASAAFGQTGNVEVVGQIGGRIEVIEVEGDRACVAEQDSLVVLDVADPAAPLRLGALRLPKVPEGIEIGGTTVYVADGTSEVLIIDIGDPAHPQLAGTYRVPGNARNVHADGGLAYVAAGTGGLRILDLSHPTSPVTLGAYPSEDECWDVVTSGSLAFLANGAYGLFILDNSDPTSPTFSGQFRTRGPAGAVFVTDVGVCIRAHHLEIVDVGNPASPTERGYLLEGRFAEGTRAYTKIFSQAQDSWSPAVGGYEIHDISNPASPVRIGACGAIGAGHRLFVADRKAYMAYFAWQAGMGVFDISDPSNPTRIGNYAAPGMARAVHLSGSFAYTADHGDGLYCIDVSDPSLPKTVGWFRDFTFAEVGSPLHVCEDADRAFISTFWDGLYIVDVSDPTSPTRLGVRVEESHGPVGPAQAAGDLLYYCFFDELRILDVSEPSSPILLSRYTPPGGADDVFVRGNRAYIAGEGLATVNVADPTSPELVVFVPNGIWESRIDVAGDYAYIVSTDGADRHWFFIHEIADSATSHPIGEAQLPAMPWNVSVANDMAYVAMGEAGLHVYDVSDPTWPKLLAESERPRMAWDVDVSDGLVCVAGEQEGLWILSYEPPPGDTHAHNWRWY
jgi:hypothetical protein